MEVSLCKIDHRGKTDHCETANHPVGQTRQIPQPVAAWGNEGGACRLPETGEATGWFVPRLMDGGRQAVGLTPASRYPYFLPIKLKHYRRRHRGDSLP